jgi:hypothetical protein
MLFSYGKQRAPSEIGHKKRFAYSSCKKERFVLNYPYITFVRTRENCALVLNEERQVYYENYRYYKQRAAEPFL